MQALVLQEYNRLVYTAVADPVLAPGEVLVQIAVCGICSSDVQGMDGSTGRRIPPIIMGHEAAGTIVACAPDVTAWRVGERVTFGCAIHCGHCPYCRRGQINLCDNRRWLGVSAPGARKNGAYAEYTAVPQQILVHLPDHLPFVQAAFTEPLSVAAHALARSQPARHERHERALVVGCGPIGLLAIQLLRIMGCGCIIAADRNAPRLALAERCGAHVTAGLGGEDVIPTVQAATQGCGVDLALEAAGSESALALCVQALAKGGALTLIGNVLPSVAFPLQAVVVKELTLYSAMAANDELPRCVDLLASGAVDVQPLISMVAPLADGAACFARLHSRDRSLIKIVLAP